MWVGIIEAGFNAAVKTRGGVLLLALVEQGCCAD
jgi:hypothetical protein